MGGVRTLLEDLGRGVVEFGFELFEERLDPFESSRRMVVR